ncbi:HD domain-containing protein [Flexistipes sinusarabici]|uniref:Ppx/GppA phosphatase family protein n=1 Tax=Flexistipes sinusarabici TaxID=2352 RepID=UPI002357E5A8
MNDKNLTIGIVDLGSNSIRLQIANVFEKSYRIVHEYREIVRIGDDLFKYGFLTKDSVNKIYACFTDIKKILESYSVGIIRAVATATLRELKEGHEIVQEIKSRFGISLEIISGEAEARLSYLAISGSFQTDKYNAIITDIGGGSAEYTLALKGKIVNITSKKLGCSRLKNIFLHHNPPEIAEVYKLKQHIQENIEDYKNYNIDLIVSTGGTVNNIANIYYLSSDKDEKTKIKYIPRKFLKDFINKIRYMDTESIKKIKGVEPKRADILLPAAINIEVLLSKSSFNGFYTFTGGLRTGLIIDTLNSMNITLPFQDLGEDIFYSQLIEIGNKFQFEEKHARHVAFLSERIFDELNKKWKLDNENRNILTAAAILHDIGNYISFSKHHKHSYYLIKNSDIAGFNYRQKLMTAHVARYHRKNLPKKSHQIYEELDSKDINIVKKLAAILRVADGLDRGHKKFIADVNIKITKDNITINPLSDKNIILEKKAFELKKDMLESVTRKNLEIL